MLDPYVILGVDRSASARDIRAAYRRAAKTAHPDAGGDPEAFALLNEAAELLGDPVRRAAFDRDGVWSRKQVERHPDADLFPLLGSLMAQIIAADQVDPEHDDLVELLRSQIAQNTNQRRQEAETIAAAVRRIERHKARLRREGDGENLMAGLVNGQLDRLRKQHEGATKAAEINDRMIVFLAGYTWDREKRKPAPKVARGFTMPRFWNSGATG